MREKDFPGGNGFTIVEILIAAVILAIGLLGVATMISRSTIADSRSYYMSRASMIMEEHIENATLAQYDKTKFNDIGDFSDDIVIDGVEYSMDCSVQNSTPLNEYTKEMTCTIDWNNKGIQARTTYVYVFSRKY